MIPQEKSAAVCRGLQKAFGIAEFEDIRPMTGGNSTTLKFRIVVRGTPYLLRVILRADDPTRHFACMRVAAEAGLAPRVWHTNVEDKICITDFIDVAPFSMAEALVRMPATLRALHALPPFSPAPNHINTSCTFLLNRGPALDGFLKAFRAANILPQDQIEELVALHERIAAVYECSEADMVSSHNDFMKADNVLFDGRRVWLIDWEAAFFNDRYADLAVVGNFVATNEEEEQAFLQAYFGGPADEYQRARYFLMQQNAHLFYTLGFLLLGAQGKPVDLGEPSMGFREFQQRFWAGEFNVSDPAVKVAYARAHRGQLMENVRLPRFGESLRIVADRQGGS